MLQDLVLPVLVLAAIAAVFGVRYLSHLNPKVNLPGYIANSQVLAQEYAQLEGKSLSDIGAQQQFEQAALLAGRGEFKGAILLLEGITGQCAEPVVFHDLGVLYAHQHDHRRALNAFREALARNPNYSPVHLALGSLPGFTVHEADPVTSEEEPNDTYLTANLISLGSPVAGEISSPRDVDFYRFSAPRSPRDVLRVELVCQSPALALRLEVYDEMGHSANQSAQSLDPGTGAILLISPMPNSTRYLEVAGNRGSSGHYTLSVTPTHAFDRYEPNDDLTTATAIQVGQTIEANIMTSADTDYYSFMAETSGNLTVTLQSQSDSLLPALAIFGSDGQPMQYAVDATEQGSRIVREIDAAEHTVYYLQVWGRSKTAGAYMLSVK